jgi:cytochrome P450
MTDQRTYDWDPREPAVLDDQRSAYDRMREQCPVAHSAFLGWSLFRHEDVSRVVADPETFSSASRHRAVPNSMDPPEHTRYRAAIDPFFTPDRIEAFAPACRAIAASILDDLAGAPEIEFVSQFAEPFALRSLCAFMGWPEGSWEYLLGWTHGNQQVSFSRDRATATVLAREFRDYIGEAIEARRAGEEAGDDTMAELMATTAGDEPISDDDLASILRNWTAGHGTVAAGLTILAQHLAENPELQRHLREAPGDRLAAADEILRSDGPLVANRRSTTREVTIGGRTIPAGENLTLMWMAANRDPAAFDAPEAIRLDRVQDENLLYGAGIHDCTGAPLARLELTTAMSVLLERTTHIEPGSSGGVRRTIYPSNGFDTLPLRLR